MATQTHLVSACLLGCEIMMMMMKLFVIHTISLSSLKFFFLGFSFIFFFLGRGRGWHTRESEGIFKGMGQWNPTMGQVHWGVFPYHIAWFCKINKVGGRFPAPNCGTHKNFLLFFSFLFCLGGEWPHFLSCTKRADMRHSPNSPTLHVSHSGIVCLCFHFTTLPLPLPLPLSFSWVLSQ